MADISSLKIETPKHLDDIFSLDCFKYNEMKGLFKQIYEYLTKVGLKFADMDKKLQSIPDFDSITNALKDFDRRLKDLEKRTSKNE
jgi:coenzyme F420-reducing hydrogenase delta subunit